MASCDGLAHFSVDYGKADPYSMDYMIIPVSRMSYTSHTEHLIIFFPASSCKIPEGNNVFRRKFPSDIIRFYK